MKIHPAQQNSLEWLMARAGVPTASEWDALLTPEFAVRKGEMPKTYLARKLAEWWLGGPLPGFQTLDMEWGKILEEEALPWYTLETGQEVQRVGLCTSDDGLVGCSPDGLIGEDGGIECKCPEPQTHCKYLLNGELPKDYAVQVHGSMFVTGRRWWKFISYRRHFPALMLTVSRDDDIQAEISIALDDFLKRFEEGKARLTEINGGPPTRHTPKPTVPFESEIPS